MTKKVKCPRCGKKMKPIKAYECPDPFAPIYIMDKKGKKLIPYEKRKW